MKYTYRDCCDKGSLTTEQLSTSPNLSKAARKESSVVCWYIDGMYECLFS